MIFLLYIKIKRNIIDLMFKETKAFTLIELLVVIVIVGVISGVLFISLQRAVDEANDAKRRVDISTIQKALLMLTTTGGALPTAYDCEFGGTNSCDTPCSDLH